MSIFFLLFAGSTPIGGYLIGLLGEAFGVRTALAVMASLSGFGVALAIGYRLSHRDVPVPVPALPSTPGAPARGAPADVH